jgi:hypothetical protein
MRKNDHAFVFRVDFERKKMNGWRCFRTSHETHRAAHDLEAHSFLHATSRPSFVAPDNKVADFIAKSCTLATLESEVT